MDKVSVIIPTYNREKLIERSVRSVLNQTYENLEVIVVDDGSADKTEDVIKSIDDDRVIYYKQENGGAGKARNTGVILATGEYIAFQDSDDVFRSKKLEIQMEYIKKNPQYSMVYSSFLRHNADGTIRIIPEAFRYPGPLEGDIFYTLLQKNSVGAPTTLMKKECFEEIGGYDESLRSLEDWEFALRYSEGFYIGYIDEILVDVYEQAGSVSFNIDGYFEARCKMIGRYKDVLIKNNMFEKVVGDVFSIATYHNCLGKVKEKLIGYIE